MTPEHECSARCGPGKQTRRVLCMRVGSRQWDHVLDKHCSHMTKPSTEVDCVGACANSQWTYSDWSEVSPTCHKQGEVVIHGVVVLPRADTKAKCSKLTGALGPFSGAHFGRWHCLNYQLHIFISERRARN